MKVQPRQSSRQTKLGLGNRQNYSSPNYNSGYKSKKLLRMTMPNPSDLRQSLLALFMILFFGSTMSLVWTFTVIVPFIKGTNYGNGSCSLAGINGVPPMCRNHTYFNKINLFTNNGKWCKEDEFCDEMISQSDCIQFYVKSDDKFFILHEDEIDITGMCQDQVHCSVQRLFNAKCDKHLNCEEIIQQAKKFYNYDEFPEENERSCWINPTGGIKTGAIARRKMPTFFRTNAFHAVFWPCSGFTLSTISCSIFWWKNRNHVLKFTQSG